jgi:hypothetical protein
MSDILTRLLLNTSDYDSKLKKAKKSAQDYSQGLGSMADKVMGGFSKMAGAIGLAMGGMEAFNKVMGSSQTAGDKYAETMAGLKKGVDEFFTALGTGDFSAFNTGLDTMISKAREAYRAMDQLGNAQMSFDIAQAMVQRDIQEGQLAAKNKFAPIDVATKGFESWKKGIDDMVNKTGQLTMDTQEYIRKAVESVAGVEGFEANMDNITKALLLDIQDKGKRDQLKEKYAKEYQEYIDAIKEADNLLRTGSKTEAEIMHDKREYKLKIQELNNKYNEAITVNALLVKYSDDELKAIGGNVKSLISLDSSISSLKREFNETAYEFNNRNKNVKGFKSIESYEGYAVYSGTAIGTTGKVSLGGISSPISGSLAAIDAEIKKAQQEYANTASRAAREAAMKTIQELQNKKGLIELQARVSMPSVGNGKSGSLAALAGGLPTTIPLTVKKEDVKNTVDYADAINSVANALTAVSTATGEGAAAFLSWASSVMTATAQAVQAIHTVVAAKTAEAAASAGASAASTPVVGWLMIGGAIAAALAAFTKIPKFADGGIVGGSSFFGDKLLARVNSGEMILNQGQQARLLSMTEGGNVRVTGDVRLNGKDIYISLRNYMSASGNKL